MLSLQAVVRRIKLAAWALFLLLFPPVAYVNGMYLAAAVLSVLALLVDLSALGSLGPEARFRRLRRGAVIGVIVLHLALLVASGLHLLRPTYGAWRRVEGSDAWNNPSLVRAEQGPLLAIGTGAVSSLGEDGRFRPVPGLEGPLRGLGAGAQRAWFVDAEGKVAWGYDARTVMKVALGAGFGARAHGAALDDALFLQQRRALVRVELDGTARTVLESASITGVATAGQRVIAVGDQLFVSGDGGRHFEARGPLSLAAPAVFAGGELIYVVQGGLLSSTLLVSEAGGALEPRVAPVRDLRALAVDPRDGKRVWASSWGEGVWRSEDGGRSWVDCELEGLEVLALVVDFGTSAREGQGAWAAAANLAIPSGIFHHALR